MTVRKIRKSITGVIKKTFFAIPKIVWGVFAVIGILFIGLMLGFAAAQNPDYEPTQLQSVSSHNKDLLRLVGGYEALSNLYQIQGQNISVILDKDLYLDHPEEIKEAFDSIEQYRKLIQIQYGRILEMRYRAALPEDYKEYRD